MRVVVLKFDLPMVPDIKDFYFVSSSWHKMSIRTIFPKIKFLCVVVSNKVFILKSMNWNFNGPYVSLKKAKIKCYTVFQSNLFEFDKFQNPNVSVSPVMYMALPYSTYRCIVNSHDGVS